MVLPLLWVLLAVLAAVLGWTTEAAAFYWVSSLMLALWLLAVGAGRVARRSLSAHRSLSVDHIPYDAEASVEVTVANDSPLPVLWLMAKESLPAGLPITGLRGRVGPLAGRASFGFRYTLHGVRRGYYEIGPTVLRMGDLFGLSQKELSAAGANSLTVFPKIVPITHARLPSRRPAGEVRARRRVLEDPTQIVGIRPYQHGDGLRRVHWRATAHTGRLQSKLFEMSSQIENLVVLNLNRSDYPGNPNDAAEAAELAITAAASVTHHMLEQRQRIGLLALARDPASPATGGMIRVSASRRREQLASILSVLGRVELGVAEDLTSVIAREKEQWPWGALVLVITPSFTSETLTSLLSLRSAGFEIHAALPGRGAEAIVAPEALQAVGIPVTSIHSEADIGALGI